MTLLQLIGLVTAVIALFGVFNTRFLRLPESIGMTAVGVIVSVVLVVLGSFDPKIVGWARHVIEQINFPDVVLHGMLGMLLFAGSLHVNLADLHRERLPIFVLATAGVVISTLVVGTGLHWGFAAFGVTIPLVYCFLFGSLIAPTDPIAVMSAFKTAGVPKNLESKTIGESLFNDATGVVLFLLIAGIASGTHQFTIDDIGKLLATEVAGGLVLGLVIGVVAYNLLKLVDSYPIEIMLTISVATGGYGLAEALHASAPLTVVVAGLIIGNKGVATAMSEKTREHLYSFWGLSDELMNMVLFGLIGVEALTLELTTAEWALCFLAIPITLFARFVSVGAPVLAMKPFHPMAPHSVKILTWGGLRGGISIALALSLPEFPGKQLIVGTTCIVVVFSLLVQGLTLTKLLTALKVGTSS